MTIYALRAREVQPRFAFDTFLRNRGRRGCRRCVGRSQEAPARSPLPERRQDSLTCESEGQDFALEVIVTALTEALSHGTGWGGHEASLWGLVTMTLPARRLLAVMEE